MPAHRAQRRIAPHQCQHARTLQSPGASPGQGSLCRRLRAVWLLNLARQPMASAREDLGIETVREGAIDELAIGDVVEGNSLGHANLSLLAFGIAGNDHRLPGIVWG